MKNVILVDAKIKLYANSLEKVTLPLKNNIRMAIWQKEGKSSTFSEWHFSSTISELNTWYDVEIMIGHTLDMDNIAIGDIMYFGSYPTAIGEGLVLSIKN